MTTVIPSDSWLNSPLLGHFTQATPKSRGLRHLVFWCIIVLFQIYAHSWTLGEGPWYIYGLVVTVDTIVIVGSYYFISGFSLPWLYQNKWAKVFISLILVYVINI